MSKGKWSMILVGCMAWGVGQGDGSGLRFRAALSGAEVVPEMVQTAARAKVRFAFAGNWSRMAYRLQIRKGTGIQTVRLHCAPAGLVGPVVADLLRPVPGGWNGSLEITAALTGVNLTGGAECAASIGEPIADFSGLADAMENGQIYVDVTSTRFPGGEMRGQVLAFIPGAMTTPSGTVAPSSGITQPRPRIIAGSTSARHSVLSGTAAVPIALGAPFPPAGVAGGVTAVRISAGLLRIPVSVLGVPATLFPSTHLRIRIPDIALSVPGDNLTLPQLSLGLPASSFTFEPTLNPPFPTTTFAIPAAVASFPAVIQAFSSTVAIPAVATFSFPAMSFSPESPFPGSLIGTMVISRGSPF